MATTTHPDRVRVRDKVETRGKAKGPAKPPAPSGGLDELGDFLNSRQGKALERTVVRGVFGMLKKRL